MFDRLVENAMEFLAKAIDGFKTEPKHSIINFYTAVELFLKARLLKEHWSLVVMREPDREKFESGDFISVSFDAACERLQKVVQSPISTGAKRNFDLVRRHRNRMVHFVHHANISAANGIEAIAREQLRAWCDLNHLLSVQWKEEFAHFASRFVDFEQRLRGHREYLEAKFEALGSTIKNEASKGTEIRTCGACNFASMRISEVLKSLLEGHCLVCGYQDKWIDYACQSCGKKSCLEEGGNFSCQRCGNSEDEQQLVNSLDESIIDKDNYFEAKVPANCGSCDSYHSIIEYGGLYLCVVSFEVSDDLSQCGFCSEHSNADLEDSYLYGCSVCVGSVGWQMEKDD